ncbi:MAG: protein-L-isoaspartate carboxylmethyltransferase [Pseudonocardia sp.]|nr:protein-L-isoaspartate carboxylmethyltransferase [Pseudonocardia sp.]
MTGPVIDMLDWRGRAERLAAQLVELGALEDPRWQAAVRETPRHEFVPRWLAQDVHGRWRPVAHDDPATVAEWTERTYTDIPLVTAVDGGTPISSSTQPGLMTRMLDVLDVADDHTVLEIGTGTGYNAALLCNRLPDEQVHSLDREPALTAVARERLCRLGYRPRLTTRDGVTGWPEHAPYDRMMATCSVPRIPSAWGGQTRAGGLVLADLKIGAGVGNLALLRAGPDGLTGRFLATSAGFMALRSTTVPVLRRARPAAPAGQVERRLRHATLPLPLGPVESFFTALALPGNHLAHGMVLDPDSEQPATDRYTAEDGSWCEIDRAAPTVARTSGPTPVLDILLAARKRHLALGRPAWNRFGLTVAPDGTHTVWLDEPATMSWTLPTG